MHVANCMPACQVNVWANMRLVRGLCPPMKERGEGYIINVNSSNGLKATPGSPVYCSSKWAMRGWSLSCHEVCRLCLTSFSTDLHHHLRNC